MYTRYFKFNICILFVIYFSTIHLFSISCFIGDFNDEDRGERGDRGRGRGRGRGGGGRGGRHNDGGEDNEAGGDDEMKKPPVTYVPPEPTDNEQEMFSSTISSGINFDKFDRIAVKVSSFYNFFNIYSNKKYNYNIL